MTGQRVGGPLSQPQSAAPMVAMAASLIMNDSGLLLKAQARRSTFATVCASHFPPRAVGRRFRLDRLRDDLKEATPRAWHGAKKSFRRIKGSIPLGELGGDRGALSNDLKDLRTARIELYRRTYAKRQRMSR
jgi:hypothetical protein